MCRVPRAQGGAHRNAILHAMPARTNTELDTHTEPDKLKARASAMALWSFASSLRRRCHSARCAALDRSSSAASRAAFSRALSASSCTSSKSLSSDAATSARSNAVCCRYAAKQCACSAARQSASASCSALGSEMPAARGASKQGTMSTYCLSIIVDVWVSWHMPCYPVE